MKSVALFRSAYLYLALIVVTLVFIRHGAEITSGLYYGSKWDGRIRTGYLLEQFKLLFESGTLYPRWFGHLLGGYGYPTFLFYQPGMYFLMLPFTYLVNEPYQAVLLYKIFIQLFTLYLIYLIARKYGCPLWGVVLLWVILLPQIEFSVTAFGAQPFLLLCVYSALCAVDCFQQQKTCWRYYILFIVGCIFLITIHPTHGYIAAMILFALFIGILWQTKDLQTRKMVLAFFVSAGCIAIILTAPYWYTAFSLKSEIGFGKTIQGFYSPRATFVRHALKSGSHSQGLLFQDGYSGIIMAPYIRFIYVTLCFLGFIMLRRHAIFIALLGAYLFIILLLTPYSLFLWENLPGLRYFQWPQRIHPIKNIFECLVIIVALSIFFSRMRITNKYYYKYYKLTYGLILCVMMATSFGVYAPLRHYQKSLPDFLSQLSFLDQLKAQRTTYRALDYKKEKATTEFRRGFQSFQTNHIELMPRTASIKGLADRHKNAIPIAEAIGHNKDKIEWYVTHGNREPWTPINLEITIPEGATPATIRINQFYFPGWRVVVNDVALALNAPTKHAHLYLDKNGLMNISFNTPGAYLISAAYDGPPHWQLRNLIILILSLSVLMVYVYYVRRVQQSTAIESAT